MALTYLGRINDSEARLIEVAMAHQRVLHAERYALELAAPEHRQAQQHAYQVFQFAGLTTHLEARLHEQYHAAYARLAMVITDGRAEVQAWTCFARSQEEAA